MKKLNTLLILLLVFIVQASNAQDAATIEKLSQIAKQDFPKNEASDITFGVEAGYPYYIQLQDNGFRHILYVNEKFEKMYSTNTIEVLAMLPAFRQKYIKRNAYPKIQKQLLKYKKSLEKGNWMPTYYEHAINNKSIISLLQYQEHGKGTITANGQTPSVGELYFDGDGNFLAKGEYNVAKALGFVLDYSKGHDDNEGNGEPPTYNGEDIVAPFKINTKYYIRNIKTDLYMDVYGNGMDDRGRVVLYKLTNSKNQQFEILSVDAAGKYKVQNVNSLKVLSGLPESTNIIQFESDAGERQIFEIEKAANSMHGVKFKLVYNNKYLGYQGTKPTNGTNIYEQNPNLDDAQEWELIPVE